MRSSLGWWRRLIAGGLVFLLAFPLAEEAAAVPRQVLLDPHPSVSTAQNQSKDSDHQAGSPGTGTSSSEETVPDNPDPKPVQAAGQSRQSGSSQSDSSQSGSSQSGASQSSSETPQNSAPKPVGTAAAPVMKSGGVAASRPAGAVIAPGKQRRARSILIRVGVIAGAAVAVGTVVALTHASPSRPN
jgi:hypothetical protein